MHVRRAVTGDADSLAWVVARLSPLLVAQVSYRLGPALRNRYDAEELVHDAWLVALPRISELSARDGRHTPVLLKFLTTTLLYRVNNLARKHLREDAVQARRTTPRLDEGAADTMAQLPADTSGVVSRALRKEREEAVRTALDELEDKDREVILLRGIEQLPNKTVAVLLGLSPEAVSMRYLRSLRRLRERLPGSVFDELTDA